MDALSQQRVAQLRGKVPASWRRIARGYTPAERWQVTFEDGSTAFAKVGSTPATAEWLRAERRVYAQVRGRFMPSVLGYDEHSERPLLLLEDLSGASWPPPWRAGDVERLVATMREVAATPLARGVLPELESERGRFAGWLNVERAAALRPGGDGARRSGSRWAGVLTRERPTSGELRRGVWLAPS